MAGHCLSRGRRDDGVHHTGAPVRIRSCTGTVLGCVGEIVCTAQRRVQAYNLGQGVRMFVYMDDAFIFACTQESAQLALDVLQQ